MIPTRILVTVSSLSQHWAEARTSAKRIETIAFGILEEEGLLPKNSSVKLVAEERFDTRVHLVFDVFYDDYQPEIAHLRGQGELRVLHVSMSKTQDARKASPAIQKMVNDRIRQIHDQTGIGSVPPFFIDYTNGKVPTYWNPRTMEKAPRPQSEGEAHGSSGS